MVRLIVYLFTFRNKYHLGWFLATTFVVSMSAVLMMAPGKTTTTQVFMGLIYFTMAPIHLWATIEAAIVTLWKKEPNEQFSKDCVWYNGLLCAIYVVLIIQLLS